MQCRVLLTHKLHENNCKTVIMDMLKNQLPVIYTSYMTARRLCFAIKNADCKVNGVNAHKDIKLV